MEYTMDDVDYKGKGGILREGNNANVLPLQYWRVPCAMFELANKHSVHFYRSGSSQFEPHIDGCT